MVRPQSRQWQWRKKEVDGFERFFRNETQNVMKDWENEGEGEVKGHAVVLA